MFCNTRAAKSWGRKRLVRSGSPVTSSVQSGCSASVVTQTWGLGRRDERWAAKLLLLQRPALLPCYSMMTHLCSLTHEHRFMWPHHPTRWWETPIPIYRGKQRLHACSYTAGESRSGLIPIPSPQLGLGLSMMAGEGSQVLTRGGTETAYQAGRRLWAALGAEGADWAHPPVAVAGHRKSVLV